MERRYNIVDTEDLDIAKRFMEARMAKMAQEVPIERGRDTDRHLGAGCSADCNDDMKVEDTPGYSEYRKALKTEPTILRETWYIGLRCQRVTP